MSREGENRSLYLQWLVAGVEYLATSPGTRRHPDRLMLQGVVGAS